MNGASVDMGVHLFLLYADLYSLSLKTVLFL
jgi:hypothetical protein